MSSKGYLQRVLPRLLPSDMLREAQSRLDHSSSWRERAKDLRDSLDAIEAAWQLAYGRLYARRSRDRFDRQSRKFFRFLSQSISNGKSFLKETTHYWRIAALAKIAKPTRPDLPMVSISTPQRLMQASTLARAVNWTIHDDEIEEAIQEKIRLWKSNPAPVDPIILQDLRTFASGIFNDLRIRRIGRSLDEDEEWMIRRLEGRYVPPSAPIPATTACVEREAGGKKRMTTYRALLQYHNDQQKLMAECLGRPYAAASLLTEDKAYLRSKEWLSEKRVLDFEPIGLRQAGGKVRIATVHNACASHMGRCFSSETIDLLSHHRWFRAGLRDESPALQTPVDRVKLFSADLSASTDYFPFSIAHAMAEGICDGLKWTRDRRRILQKILGAQRCLHNGEEFVTTNGVLLGTGFSWTLLSIVNAWAATHGSGADVNFDRTFSCCGDDLIALWPQWRWKNYVTNMESVRLVVNTKKSYIAPSFGVFCERLYRVSLDIDKVQWVAEEQRIDGLKELSAAQWRLDHTGALGTTASLQEKLRTNPNAIIGSLIRSTLRRLSTRLPYAGPVIMGGNGKMATDKNHHQVWRLICAYVTGGPVCYHARVRSGDRKAIVAKLLESPLSPQTMVPLSEVCTMIDCARARLEAATGVRVKASSPLTDRQKCGIVRRVWRNADQLTVGEILRAPFLDRKGRRILRKIASFSIIHHKTPPTATVRRLARILPLHARDPKVNGRLALELMEASDLPKARNVYGDPKPWSLVSSSDIRITI